MKRFALRDKADANPQTYALGLKEVWELPEGSPGHSPGDIYHTVGYPLEQSTYGGGFLYHMGDRRIALGLVLALDYRNPYINTFQEFQRWKAHPLIAKQLEGGTCLQYGARSLNEGRGQAGLRSIMQYRDAGVGMLNTHFAQSALFLVCACLNFPISGILYAQKRLHRFSWMQRHEVLQGPIQVLSSCVSMNSLLSTFQPAAREA